MTGATEEEGWSRACDWSWMTHKLTCFRDERIQALGVPECLAPTCSALLQPILLGWAGWVTRECPTALNCLLLPLSLETHSSVSIGQMKMVWIMDLWSLLRKTKGVWCVGFWDGAWIQSKLQSKYTKKKLPLIRHWAIGGRGVDKILKTKYLLSNIHIYHWMQAPKIWTTNTA